ncbi:MAG: FtsX-like permease family protein [Rhodospirillaceae bacterium]|nr:FtsX-like permease family protein [Rhodospirillaceae bacterium]
MRLARRELRGGIKGFRIFLACLALGVATIAGIGSIADALVAGLEGDGRVLLGGDVSLRVVHRPISKAQKDWLQDRAAVSEVISMRSMAHRADGAGRTLISLKAVDNLYPLYGDLVLDKAAPPARLFAPKDGVWGALVEPRILERLGLASGDRVRVGDATYEIRALVRSEPDRIGGARSITFGPRFIVSHESLGATGLVRPGAQVRYRYRLRLPETTNLEAFRATLDATFPDAGWRVRDRTAATPGVKRVIDRTTQFITLVGLTALLIGGVGAGNAVRSYLGGKASVIATLKCMGATKALIFQIYLIEIGIMAVIGIGIGLLVGAVLPVLAASVISQFMALPLQFGLYPAPLLLATAFGALTAMAFSLWPLARACGIAPGSLFRDLVAPEQARPGRAIWLAVGFLIVSLAALAIVTAYDRVIAAWFVGGSAIAFALFYGAGRAVMALAARLNTASRTARRTTLRLALANLYRPGAQTANIVLSMGLGLTVLVAVVVVEGNLTRQIRSTLPANAPGFYFIDIQPDQVAPFEATVRAVDGVRELTRVPMLRGRITRVKGVPARDVKVAPNVAWVLRNDRGLTWSARPPEGVRLVAGEWWPADYKGPPLISFDERAARGMGVGVGDTLEINVLGRPIIARIANLREIVWGTLQLNFVIILSPGIIEKAPQTHIATLMLDARAESPVEDAVSAKFANITAIRVKDILVTLTELMERIAGAVRVTASITVLAGALVLGGAIAGGHQRRVYDGVVLKVLGARRKQILATFLMEYAFLALSTAFAATIMGSVAGWAVLTKVMRVDWSPVPAAILVTALGASLFIIVLALAGTWRILGQKAAPLLRND